MTTWFMTTLWQLDLDANLLRRTCGGLCLNGGSCTLTTNGTTKCLCPSGFFGDRCDNDGTHLYLLAY